MKTYLNRRCPEDVSPTNHSLLWRKRSAMPADEEGGPTLERVAIDYMNTCFARHKRSTCSTYARVLQTHILPKLGYRDVTEITMEDIIDLLCEKASPEDGLAPATLRSIITMLRGIFQYAERFGCAVDWKDIHGPAHTPGFASVISKEHQMKLRFYCAKNLRPDTLGVMICLFTGIRLGEICAMKWEDIDLKNGTIRVRRTVQRIHNPESTGEENVHDRTHVVFDAPKSINSHRCIPLPLPLLRHLYTCKCDGECYVLTGQQDVFLEPRSFQKHYKSILAEAGVPYMHFHALRHTFATNCVELGFDVKTLSMILGHSSVSTTLNIYVHPSVSVMKAFMERIE